MTQTGLLFETKCCVNNATNNSPNYARLASTLQCELIIIVVRFEGLGESVQSQVLETLNLISQGWNVLAAPLVLLYMDDYDHLPNGSSVHMPPIFI